MNTAQMAEDPNLTAAGSELSYHTSQLEVLALETELQTVLETEFSQAERDLLNRTTETIRQTCKRRFREDYTIGKQLSRIKGFFGKRRKLYLHWAGKKTGMSESSIERMRRIGEAFQIFEEKDQFEQLDRIGATLLDKMSRTRVPVDARIAFFNLVCSGVTPTETQIEALIREHQTEEEIELSERFITEKERVATWGELQLCDEDENAKFYLIDQNGIRRTFKNFHRLREEYKQWRHEQLCVKLVNKLQKIFAPHWSIHHSWCRSQPLRVEIVCLIPGIEKSIRVNNARIAEEWWYEKAKKWTEEYFARLDLETDTPELDQHSCAAELEELLSYGKAIIPSCKNCGWHDPNHEANIPGEVHCGFSNWWSHREDQVHEIALGCMKWYHPNAVPADSDDIFSSQAVSETEVESVSERLPSVEGSDLATPRKIAEPAQITKVVITRDVLEDMEDQELKRLQQAIDEVLMKRRNA
ncbi:hypothetical protein ACQ4M3_20600 [Leptolyngbya sp. AN03gr2]|uniref:hypothetical protein n=1 Tax=unclassified Leptolyngbya TaxID=2650499 RepID=UPI003D3150B5